MNEIKKILAVVDPTVADQPALRRAAWLAKHSSAELELLVCYYNEYLSGDRLFDSPSLEKARDEVIQNHEKHLEVLAEPLRNDGIIVKTSAVWDHPLYEGIVWQRHRRQGHASSLGGNARTPDQYRLESHSHVPDAAVAREAPGCRRYSCVRCCHRSDAPERQAGRAG